MSGGFLDAMAHSSKLRVIAAKQRETYAALAARAESSPPAPAVRLSPRSFDVIAELKLRSPAQGILGSAEDNWLGRVVDYARGGAAAVSVLTEPSRFDGSLEHLRQAAIALRPFGVPAMRKDFLLDPYQVLEARAAGAGGVLVIVRMLSRDQLIDLLDTAAAHGMFVLLEAFDRADLEVACSIEKQRIAIAETVLIGINSRDLQTLKVVSESFANLAPYLPDRWPAVAESGVVTAADASRVAGLGFRFALMGTALMAHDNPASALADILETARTVAD